MKWVIVEYFVVLFVGIRFLWPRVSGVLGGTLCLSVAVDILPLHSCYQIEI
jgi:hypothetical protein